MNEPQDWPDVLLSIEVLPLDELLYDGWFLNLHFEVVVGHPHSVRALAEDEFDEEEKMLQKN